MGMTIQEVARELNMYPDMVRRIEYKALIKLRKSLLKLYPIERWKEILQFIELEREY